MSRSDMRDRSKNPDVAEPVIGPRIRATRWHIRATLAFGLDAGPFGEVAAGSRAPYIGCT
jgi:hypothetical protein